MFWFFVVSVSDLWFYSLKWIYQWIWNNALNLACFSLLWSILAEKNQNIILFKDTHVFGERRVIYLFNKYDKSVLIFELDLTLKLSEGRVDLIIRWSSWPVWFSPCRNYELLWLILILVAHSSLFFYDSVRRKGLIRVKNVMQTSDRLLLQLSGQIWFRALRSLSVKPIITWNTNNLLFWCSSESEGLQAYYLSQIILLLNTNSSLNREKLSEREALCQEVLC